MRDLPLYLETLLFFLPAGASNMAPVFASKLPLLRRWNTPLDAGRLWHGKRVFGPHKTWRGLFSGILLGTVVGILVQHYFLIEYSLGIYITASIAMSAGALIGDAVESFFKRQRGVDSGKSWFPFDQTDYIIGGIIFVLPLYLLSPVFIACIIGWYFGLHLLSSYIGYLLGLKDQPI